MERISAAAGATGAALLQSDSRTPDIPRTAGVDEYFRSYFAEGWHARDVRAERAVPLLLRGERVITDQDILTGEEMQRVGLYAESLLPHGLRWFAAIGFWAGPALWGLTIQRTNLEGAFDGRDKCILAQFSQRLTEVATLSQAVGRAVLRGTTNALQLVGQAAVALDRSGLILEANLDAEHIFDDDIRIRNRRLVIRDRQASATLDAFINRMRTTSDTSTLPAAPIIVQRRGKRPLVVRVLPVDGAARSPFLGARVLLVLSDLEAKLIPASTLIAQTFGLTPAETRLAALVAAGRSLRRAADELGISYETARVHLRAVFDKTSTHRQSELVATIMRLSQSASLRPPIKRSAF